MFTVDLPLSVGFFSHIHTQIRFSVGSAEAASMQNPVSQVIIFLCVFFFLSYHTNLLRMFHEQEAEMEEFRKTFRASHEERIISSELREPAFLISNVVKHVTIHPARLRAVFPGSSSRNQFYPMLHFYLLQPLIHWQDGKRRKNLNLRGSKPLPT